MNASEMGKKGQESLRKKLGEKKYKELKSKARKGKKKKLSTHPLAIKSNV